jgi:hypothetical protein
LVLNNLFYRQTLPAIPAEKLEDIAHTAENFDVVGVDEGQFVSILKLKGMLTVKLSGFPDMHWRDLLTSTRR